MKNSKITDTIKILSKIFLIIIIVITGVNTSAQNNEDKNPILYIESFSGGYTGETGGFLWGGELNYQINKNLLSLRYSQTIAIGVSYELIFPISNTNAFADEIALLYGRRKINEGHSLSISLGPSYNIYATNSLNDLERHRIKAFGVAFETNIKWFRKEKSNPFGFSFGLKLSGNISKNSYVGFSLMLGAGWHKIYN